VRVNSSVVTKEKNVISTAVISKKTEFMWDCYITILLHIPW